MKVLAVSEVSRHISNVLRTDRLLSDVWIRGEIADLTRSSTGHFYFALRGGNSQLRCVLFRGSAARLEAAPQAGASVVLHGSFSFYEAGGRCELCVDLLFPEGLGVARMQLEALKAKLEGDGLFATQRKRPLPPFPRRVGLVTSDGSAVLHDVLQVLGRRYPLAEVVLSPTTVQGEIAPLEICAALRRLFRLHNDVRRLDVIIVARGGGDEHDLAAFNDERVARALYASPVPIVSAIGHETDVTLADYVADVRAPTPSAAAELITPDTEALRQAITSLAGRARQTLWRSCNEARLDLQTARDRLLSRSPAASVARHRVEITAGLKRGAAGVHQQLKVADERLRGRVLQLDALSPARTLERGYAICSLDDGAVLRSVYQVAAGDPVDIRVLDGVVVGHATARRLARSSNGHGPGGHPRVTEAEFEYELRTTDL